MPDGGDDPQGLAQYIAEFYAKNGDGPAEARLGAVFRRYAEIRGKLAMANMRLVAHVAKRFRDRGIAHSDLMQDGFCGLLEAIDRFDMSHGTKLATYATWWIRQSMQQAVAGGAYPVRLSPRHLRQLAQNQDEIDRTGRGDRRRRRDDPPHPHRDPADALARRHDRRRDPLQPPPDDERPRGRPRPTTSTAARPSAGSSATLRPREQEVLALRFGLDGKSRSTR